MHKSQIQADGRKRNKDKINPANINNNSREKNKRTTMCEALDPEFKPMS